MPKPIIGIMGPGNAPQEIMQLAQQVGEAIAKQKWVLLTGGRSLGVMDAASRGAKTGGGLVIGILPGNDAKGMSGWVDIPIFTGMGSGRNQINALSSNVVMAIGLGAGTASEVSLAIKAGKPVILMGMQKEDRDFFQRIGGDQVHVAETAEDAVTLIKKLV